MPAREVVSVVTAHRQLEGGGFLVRRPLPTSGLDYADPFLLIDEGGPVAYGPGEAKGAPEHPHRGFETVTYVLEGAIQEDDTAGGSGVLQAGDVRWMTAGAGVVHSSTPTPELLESGGRIHVFQIWVNLPARLKMTRPRYQDIPWWKIPTAETTDRLARVKVIAGEVLGKRGVVETHTPIVYQDWTLSPGADVTVPIARDHNGLAYVFGGTARIGGRDVREGQLAVLGRGDEVRLRASTDTRLLLLAGVPIGEPVARYGPFVMNTEQEIREAFDDYRSGRLA
jgi:redox-sensitive bicupin YhaK (pirin superfamily)